MRETEHATRNCTGKYNTIATGVKRARESPQNFCQRRSRPAILGNFIHCPPKRGKSATCIFPAVCWPRICTPRHSLRCALQRCVLCLSLLCAPYPLHACACDQVAARPATWTAPPQQESAPATVTRDITAARAPTRHRNAGAPSNEQRWTRRHLVFTSRRAVVSIEHPRIFPRHHHQSQPDWLAISVVSAFLPSIFPTRIIPHCPQRYMRTPAPARRSHPDLNLSSEGRLRAMHLNSHSRRVCMSARFLATHLQQPIEPR